MTTITSDARFLGLDLRALWSEVRQVWAFVQGRAPLSWLTPIVPVQLLQNDGGESLWRGGVKQVATIAQGAKTTLVAIELPDTLVLHLSWSPPAVDAGDLPGAIALHAQSASPFPEADQAWGYRIRTGSGAGALVIDIVLASRRQIDQYVQTQASRLAGASAPEVWVSLPSGAPIVMQGFGESERQAQAARGRLVRYAFLGVACALLAAIALTPALQLRFRALDAYAAHEALSRKTAPLVMQREALMKTAEGLGALADFQAARIEPLRILDRLTRTLPDDTALQNFVLKDQKVTITGLTANASSLMQTLSEQEGLRDVRAPSPATRSGGDAKENFTIEFTVDPRIYGVVPAAPAPGGSASAASAAAQVTPASGVKP